MFTMLATLELQWLVPGLKRCTKLYEAIQLIALPARLRPKIKIGKMLQLSKTNDVVSMHKTFNILQIKVFQVLQLQKAWCEVQ